MLKIIAHIKNQYDGECESIYADGRGEGGVKRMHGHKKEGDQNFPDFVRT